MATSHRRSNDWDYLRRKWHTSVLFVAQRSAFPSLKVEVFGSSRPWSFKPLVNLVKRWRISTNYANSEVFCGWLKMDSAESRTGSERHVISIWEYGEMKYTWKCLYLGSDFGPCVGLNGTAFPWLGILKYSQVTTSLYHHRALKSPTITMVDFNILKQMLSPQQVLEPGTPEYSKAGRFWFGPVPYFYCSIPYLALRGLAWKTIRTSAD